MSCPFCLEMVDPSSFKSGVLPEWPFSDRIIDRNQGALLFPGLGPVVPKTPYVLGVPKTCATSLLTTPKGERVALFDLLDKLLDNPVLFPTGHALVFEHGGSVGNSGCKCIDHCHIHIMNIAGQWALLPKILSRYYSDRDFCISSDSESVLCPYLFAGIYRRQSRVIVGRLADVLGRREPQFFRAAIAQMTGGTVFDYRLKENLSTMIDTYRLAVSKSL